MRVNQGGEPEQDDYGLPQVDIVIPDDARELERDVHEYHRELRALRRQARSRRWRAPWQRGLIGSQPPGTALHRTGLMLPLIAGCLVLAMLSGMVLTMFSANSYFSGATRSVPPSGARGREAPPPVTSAPPTGTRLPDKQIDVEGTPVALRTLSNVVLALIPRTCACDSAVRQLLDQAWSAGVAVYLVGPRGSEAEIAKLASSARHEPAGIATDTADVLLTRFGPGLTAVLVDSHGYETSVPGLRPGFRLEGKLAALRPGY
jgi:hypothetical protein